MISEFTYVHVPGCLCADRSRLREMVRLRDSGTPLDVAVEQVRPYAERLAAARADLRAQHGEDFPVEEYVPEGSCLGWLHQVGEGWPRDHRDHRLLSLYRAAVAARTAGRAGGVLEATWHSTTEALGCAIAEAPWGAQPDGSFITRAGHWPSGLGHTATLHAPAKGGPLAVVVAQFHGTPFVRELRTAAAAREIRETERAAARKGQIEYDVARKAVARRLRKGLSVEYRLGQEGGTVVAPRHIVAVARTDDAGHPVQWLVSARGALRAAGMTREGADALLSQAWDRPDWEAGGRLMLSLGGFEVRRARSSFDGSPLAGEIA